jgi:hypothetical protein
MRRPGAVSRVSEGRGKDGGWWVVSRGGGGGGREGGCGSSSECGEVLGEDVLCLLRLCLVSLTRSLRGVEAWPLLLPGSQWDEGLTVYGHR